MHGYLIGQRVIVDNKEIAVVIPHPPEEREIERETRVWVLLQSGIKQFRGRSNVKPLPGGQM